MAEVVGLDHVQLAMPAGQEPQARAFYSRSIEFVVVAERGWGMSSAVTPTSAKRKSGRAD